MNIEVKKSEEWKCKGVYPPPYVSVCPSLICFDRCLVWSFPTGSFSGLWCCLVAMIDLGCVLVVRDQYETAGGRSSTYCWGTRHISPTGDLYLAKIPEIGCLVAADEQFHWWFDWWVPDGLLAWCWLVCSFLDRIVLSTLLVLTGMSHLVEIPLLCPIDSLGEVSETGRSTLRGSSWIGYASPSHTCRAYPLPILTPFHLVENPGMRGYCHWSILSYMVVQVAIF